MNATRPLILVMEKIGELAINFASKGLDMSAIHSDLSVTRFISITRKERVGESPFRTGVSSNLFGRQISKQLCS